MFGLFRGQHVAQPPQPQPPPAWQVLAPSAFRLLTFAMIACYVMLLVAEGHSLAGAVAAAVAVAIGAWAGSVTDPFGPVLRFRR